MASQLSNSIAKRVGPYDDRKRTIIVTNNEMRLDDYQKVTEIIIEHQRQRDILKPKENIKFFCLNFFANDDMYIDEKIQKMIRVFSAVGMSKLNTIQWQYQ